MNARTCFCLVSLLLTLMLAPIALAAESCDYVSDIFDSLNPDVKQGWGKLGLNTATAPPDGRKPSPLKIGEEIFEKGIGHHASGHITLQLPKGEYAAFEAKVGIHPQGGERGSVVFQVFVDEEKRFESEVLTDSSAAVPIHVSLEKAKTLKLVATDSGDGIGCDMANWAEARLIRDPNALRIGEAQVLLNGQAAPEPSADASGFSLIAHDAGPQVAALGETAFVVCLDAEESMVIDVAINNLTQRTTLQAEATLITGPGATLKLSLAGAPEKEAQLREGSLVLETVLEHPQETGALRLSTTGASGESLIRWSKVRLVTPEKNYDLQALPSPPTDEICPPRVLPALRPALEAMLIEWDWRLQDGIESAREPISFALALERLLAKGDRLIEDLQQNKVALEKEAAQWQALKEEQAALVVAQAAPEAPEWESLWRRCHQLRRQIVFANPLADVGPLLFAKRAPAAFSHQLTQYYGSHARAGGGLFVLDTPGASMQCRQLVGPELPPGNFMQPEISYEGDRILFAYCEVPFAPTRENKEERLDRHFHLFEIKPDGSGLRQMTEGPYNDFSPCLLPDGKLMFLSTRRGGYHRCGRGPCPVYTLTLADGDGSNIQTVSYHETQEWDPAVLSDGRIIYTRWDYVDRNAVHYQQLWTVRPDGSAPAAYYGNNTFNPVGVWEARPVPGSPYIMATAAAHHAMTAGSIILLDTTEAIDGPKPIIRLTPDAPFPESETYVAPRNWHAPGSPKEYETPEEAKRWPGHCYRSPYPLSEDYFLAAYSYDALIGEPDGNKVNMFGLYFVDAFGNRELLYRDANISSLWPMPLRARSKPPVIPSTSNPTLADEGTFFLQDVYASDPSIPKGSIKALRIAQVLVKTTPHANNPPVGMANASPGKQVLGTVPVEADGSAYFRAPARLPLAFQALDAQGKAIQVMRSVTYLQPGEQASCVGCHEHRLTAPPHSALTAAMDREPSVISPGPDGSKPFSYPILVQPVLDKHCVCCHDGAQDAAKKKSPLVLTGAAEGRYSKSYNALVKLVPYSSWGGLEENNEPLTQPDTFGARASTLMKMLEEGHHEVRLNAEERNRLITWMDTNALFYGTFKPEDQELQRVGKRIAGPELN